MLGRQWPGWQTVLYRHIHGHLRGEPLGRTAVELLGAASDLDQRGHVALIILLVGRCSTRCPDRMSDLQIRLFCFGAQTPFPARGKTSPLVQHGFV